jgi:hypothetical protein
MPTCTPLDSRMSLAFGPSQPGSVPARNVCESPSSDAYVGGLEVWQISSTQTFVA